MPFAYLTQKNNQMCLQNNKDNYPARNVRFHLIERNQQFITTDCDPQSQIIFQEKQNMTMLYFYYKIINN